jgi:hypothetical protein
MDEAVLRMDLHHIEADTIGALSSIGECRNKTFDSGLSGMS